MASITVATPSGTSQSSDIDVPIRKVSDRTLGLQLCMAPGDFVYLSAQNSNDTGTIECRIEVDGHLIASNTSSGAYSIASCKGSA